MIGETYPAATLVTPHSIVHSTIQFRDAPPAHGSLASASVHCSLLCLLISLDSLYAFCSIMLISTPLSVCVCLSLLLRCVLRCARDAAYASIDNLPRLPMQVRVCSIALFFLSYFLPHASPLTAPVSSLFLLLCTNFPDAECRQHRRTTRWRSPLAHWSS